MKGGQEIWKPSLESKGTTYCQTEASPLDLGDISVSEK